MKLSRVLWIQAVYYLVTALWPIIDRESFEAVTGEKCDFWLVITVSSVLIPLALTLISLVKHQVLYPSLILGAGSAFALMTIDIYYYLKDEIGPAYLADALAELILIIMWITVNFRYRKGETHA